MDSTWIMKEIEMNQRRNSVLERKFGIYSFLLLSLAEHDEYRFPVFDEEDERASFCLSFSENSSIRKCSLVERPIGRLVIKVLWSSGCFRYQTILASDESSVALDCCALGYKSGFREFSTEVEVLEECLRLKNLRLKIESDLVKTTGECSVCLEEGEALIWPCHKSHIVCVDCTSKILHRKSSCPLCRTVLSVRKEVDVEVEVEVDDDDLQLWDGDSNDEDVDDFYVRLRK